MDAETPSSWQDKVVQELTDADKPFVQIAAQADTYVVASESDSRDFHYIIDLGWIVLCTCKGFRFRTDCFHVRAFFDGGEGARKLTVVPS